MINYLYDLSRKYPIMRNWSSHPEKAILEMAREGNLEAIQSMECICECISRTLWQEIANTAAQHGRTDIVEWVNTKYSVNWEDVGVIARDAGYPEIASYADGYDQVIETDLSNDYDDYPINLSGPVGDPMEDRGEYILDWRMQDYGEEFLPEEPNIIGDDIDSYDTEDTFTPYSANNPGWGFQGDNLRNQSIYQSEFEDDEDADIMSNTYRDDIIPA